VSTQYEGGGGGNSTQAVRHRCRYPARTVARVLKLAATAGKEALAMRDEAGRALQVPPGCLLHPALPPTLPPPPRVLEVRGEARRRGKGCAAGRAYY
jgi:hypothetical protein